MYHTVNRMFERENLKMNKSSAHVNCRFYFRVLLEKHDKISLNY